MQTNLDAILDGHNKHIADMRSEFSLSQQVWYISIQGCMFEMIDQ